MSEKKISIIIPTHNRATLFVETIDSILNQSSENWEVVVVDDNSDEENYNLIQQNCDRHSNIYLCKNTKGKGASSSRNFGANKASFDYLMFLDSDDILHPNCIENRLKRIKDFPEKDFVVFAGVKVFNTTPEDNQTLWNIFTEENDIDRFLRIDNPWHTSSPVWKKQSFLQLGGFRESSLVWNDWEIHLRAIIQGLSYVKLETPTDCYYRKHEMEAISKIDKNHKSTINRFETIQHLYQLLENHNKLNSYRKQLIAQQIFLMQHELNRSDNKVKKYVFSFISQKNLLNFIQYYFWKVYLNNFENSEFLKLFFDKMAYKLFKYHFLEFNNTFLKIKAK
jgi:glycosyltransferase involved in cell wall biosynthesis